MNRFILATALAFCAATVPALANTRPVVVELFTSQGCSSCPPADAVLNELAGRADVLALGFHVDYWDNLGWKDPLSAAGSTARQHDYAAQFGRKSVYTPQIVIEGQTQLVGSDRAAVLQTIAGARPQADAPITFAADGRSVAIGAGSGRGKVIVVTFIRSRSNTVRHGENAGRTALDANGVESVATAAVWDGQSIALKLDPVDSAHGIAVLVQADNGRILGAATELGGKS